MNLKKLLAVGALVLPLTLSAHFIGQAHFDITHDGKDVNGLDTMLTQYTAYCGPSSGNYTYSTPIYTSELTAAALLADFPLPDGEWYCTATASNAQGESAYGNEIHFFLLNGVRVNPGVPVAPSISELQDA